MALPLQRHGRVLVNPTQCGLAPDDVPELLPDVPEPLPLPELLPLLLLLPLLEPLEPEVLPPPLEDPLEPVLPGEQAYAPETCHEALHMSAACVPVVGSSLVHTSYVTVPFAHEAMMPCAQALIFPFCSSAHVTFGPARLRLEQAMPTRHNAASSWRPAFICSLTP